MPSHVLKSRRHLFLVAAFQFVAGILFLGSVMSIAVLLNWYAEKSDRPVSLSMAIHSLGCVSILLNLIVAFMSFDGLQRSIHTTEIFASQSVLVAFAAVLVVETLQLYLYHTVSRPHQLHSYSGTGRDFSDWMHWATAAFAGPILKTVLILVYSKFAGSQEHYVKAHLTLDIE